MQHAFASKQTSRPGAQGNARSVPQRIAAPHGMSNHRVLQRKCACGGPGTVFGECCECKAERGAPLQRHGAGRAAPAAVPPIVHDVLRSPGQPLDAATRALMEARFGHDFSKVRVHTDAKAAESAHAVNALAYTVGRDVVFGAGRYAPATEDGHRLIAHELTHVRQQWNAAPGPCVFDPAEARHEHEADEVSSRLLAPGPDREAGVEKERNRSTPAIGVSALRAPFIQRKRASESLDDETKEEGAESEVESDEDELLDEEQGLLGVLAEWPGWPGWMRRKPRKPRNFRGGGLISWLGGTKGVYTHARNLDLFHRRPRPRCNPVLLNLTFQWVANQPTPLSQPIMNAQINAVAANWRPCNTSIQIVINTPVAAPPPAAFAIVMNRRAARIRAALRVAGIPRRAFLPPVLNYGQPGPQNAQVIMN
jgi:hypothetical protein